MKILISGATGGLGQELVNHALSFGYEVFAIGRNEKIGHELTQKGAKFIKCDICNFNWNDIVKNIDFVIHAAALSSPWGRPKDFIDININATQNLLNASKENNVKAFVFISSPSVYAREIAQIGLKETDEIAQNPMNEYARTKGLAEEIVQAQNADKFKTIIIRPRAIIGQNDNVLLPRFMRLIEKGRFPLFNDGNALIEPTDVKDVANAVFLAIKKYKTIGGEVFNISGGKAMPLKNMIEIIADNMGKKIKFININYGFARFMVRKLAWICTKLPNYPEPILTPYSLAALSFSQTFDLTKARKMLEYIPQYDAFESAANIAKNLKNAKN